MIPSDFQRAPSDRDVYGQSFELVVDDAVQAIVAARPAAVISVWRKGRWVLQGGPEDTGGKVYAHASTNCLRFTMVEVIDLPADHPLRFQAIGMNGWADPPREENGDNIVAVMRRVQKTMPPLTTDDIVCPAGWTRDPVTGHGIRIEELGTHDGFYIKPAQAAPVPAPQVAA